MDINKQKQNKQLSESIQNAVSTGEKILSFGVTSAIIYPIWSTYYTALQVTKQLNQITKQLNQITQDVTNITREL